MSAALHLGRPALIQALERVLDGIDENVAADFNRLDDHWQTRYDELKAGAEEAQARLESEIAALQIQVASLTSALEQAQATRQAEAADVTGDKDDKMPPKARAGTNDDALLGSDEPSISLAPAVAELQQSLDKSRTRYEAVKEQLDSAVAVAQKRKAETLSWVKYADSLELKIKRLEKKKASGRQSSAAHTIIDPATIPLTPATLEKPQFAVQKPNLSASFSSAASSFLGNPAPDEEGGEPTLPSSEGVAADGSNEAAPWSTQSEASSDAPQPELPTPRATDPGDNDDRVVIKNEPSSDGPEVVWERPAKKPRRDGEKEQEGQNDPNPLPQTPRIKPAVKRERSGNMLWAGVANYRESQESIDLDEGQLTVPTPRKRHLFYHQRSLLEKESDDSSEAASQERQERVIETAPRRAILPPPATPLAPISVNVRRGVKDPAKALKQLKRGVESLAEDNQGYSSPSGVQKGTEMDPPSTAKPSRLNSLLNSRPAEPSPVSSLSRCTSSAQRGDIISSPVSGMFGQPPPARILPRLRDGENSLTRTPNTAARGSIVPSAAGPTPRRRETREPGQPLPATPTTNPLTAALMAAKVESAARKESLRGRPVDQLKLEDFKINPALNNGETFAYNEVVRSRADRANLAGCTDPQCCGREFGGMATSELDAAGVAHISRSASIVLMERHLGDDAFVLARMSPEEKKELWIAARTKELADKYGKHRHRYHRRASPPGFWDTDFPTTQEDEQNRAEAEKVEKTAVQERYREAMRPGGRWLFRDE